MSKATTLDELMRDPEFLAEFMKENADSWEHSCARIASLESENQALKACGVEIT